MIVAVHLEEKKNQQEPLEPLLPNARCLVLGMQSLHSGGLWFPMAPCSRSLETPRAEIGGFLCRGWGEEIVRARDGIGGVLVTPARFQVCLGVVSETPGMAAVPKLAVALAAVGPGGPQPSQTAVVRGSQGSSLLSVGFGPRRGTRGHRRNLVSQFQPGAFSASSFPPRKPPEV